MTLAAEALLDGEAETITRKAVELAKVGVYSEIARLVFKNLFNIEVRRAGRKPQEQLGGFFASWARLEQVISQLAAEYRSDLTVTGAPLPPAMAVVPALQNMGVIPGDTAREIDFFRALRNKVVHGVGDYSELLGTDAAKRVDMLTETVLTISDEPDTQEHRSVRSGHRGARS